MTNQKLDFAAMEKLAFMTASLRGAIKNISPCEAYSLGLNIFAV